MCFTKDIGRFIKSNSYVLFIYENKTVKQKYNLDKKLVILVSLYINTMFMNTSAKLEKNARMEQKLKKLSIKITLLLLGSTKYHLY